jgi:hypothetical protein
MTVKISKPAINLREELASLRNQGGLPKEDKLYVDTLENGDFSAGTVGWTEYNYLASVSASNGQLTVTSTGTGNGSWAIQKIATKVGKTYKVSAEAVSATTGYIRANNNSIHPWDLLGNASFVSSAGQTRTFTFVAEQDHTFIYIGTANGSVGQSFTFNSITVQEVGENLVTNGTFDTDSGWTLGTNASISGGTLSYSGGAGNGFSYISVPWVVGKTYTISVTVSGLTTGSFDFRAGNTTVDTDTVSTNGTHTLQYTVPTGANENLILVPSSGCDGSFDDLRLVEGAHPVIQSIPHGYDVKDVYIDGELAREGEAYDYQVKTDGINQWLKPTVEPTATTETVVIGVRK